MSLVGVTSSERSAASWQAARSSRSCFSCFSPLDTYLEFKRASFSFSSSFFLAGELECEGERDDVGCEEEWSGDKPTWSDI